MNVNAIALILLSFIPGIETRYTLPMAIATGYDPLLSYFVAAAAATLLAIILSYGLWIGDKIIRKIPRISQWWERYVDRARKKAEPYVNKYGAAGLIIFVSIPLPGTGIWTGSIAGYILGIPPHKLALYTSGGGILANTITFLSILGVFQMI